MMNSSRSKSAPSANDAQAPQARDAASVGPNDALTEGARLRWSVYGVLIAVSIGGIVGRVAAVNSVDKIRLEAHLKSEHDKTGNRPNWRQQRPFLSGNDRSRWCTVRALVEHGTYAIDDIQNEPNWDTIDMVRHNGQLYSSKPPLLATLVAAEYWVLYQLAGRLGLQQDGKPLQPTLGTHPYEYGRAMLLLTNVLPLLAAFLVLGRLVERFGQTDWGRIFAMATGTLATFLSTFAITLNNHLIAAVCALFAIAAAVPIVHDNDRRARWFFAAGFFSAMAAANELPALALCGLLGLLLLVTDAKRTLLWGVPGALVVAAAFFGTNYAAHGQWSVPYSQRSDGRQLFEISTELVSPLDAGETAGLRMAFANNGIDLKEPTELETVTAGQRWIVQDDPRDDNRRFAIQNRDGRLFVHAWRNWYDYSYEREGKRRNSYWRTMEGRSPVDKGEPSRWRYAVHCLVGHHGLFSLTPVWLLTMIGIVLASANERSPLRVWALLIGTASPVCLAFYLLYQNEENRNYGGTTSGLRWMFWFAPLWSLLLLPAVDSAWRRRGLVSLCLALLGWSLISVSYPTWNPWSHPWLTNVTNYLGWSGL